MLLSWIIVARGVGMDLRTKPAAPVAVRPTDDELDMFGLTHPGLKRANNQDHFLLATIHAQISVLGSSLTGLDQLPLKGNRLATLLLVADGVGGSSDGGAAAQLATQTVMQYVASSLRCYHEISRGNDPEFLGS